MKKITGWLFKSKVDLSKLWWHRFFKVIFILLSIVFAVYLMVFTANSYTQVVHEWRFVEGLSNRLSKAPNSGKVFSIHELYKENEVITEDKYPSEMNFGLKDKEYLLPFSPLFLDSNQMESFCSSDLSKHVKDIASKNNIKLFSSATPTFERLYSDINIFTAYLQGNSYDIRCVMIDSYTLTENGTTTVYSFLRPVDTSKYYIYNYANNFSWFIFYTVLVALFYMLCIVGVMLIYYKIILYVVYGKISK